MKTTGLSAEQTGSALSLDGRTMGGKSVGFAGIGDLSYLLQRRFADDSSDDRKDNSS